MPLELPLLWSRPRRRQSRGGTFYRISRGNTTSGIGRSRGGWMTLRAGRKLVLEDAQEASDFDLEALQRFFDWKPIWQEYVSGACEIHLHGVLLPRGEEWCVRVHVPR